VLADQDSFFNAIRYRISYEKVQGSNGLITHLEEEAEAASMDTTAIKDGDIPDMNGEDYGEEEEAGSGDDSDDVCPTFSDSRI